MAARAAAAPAFRKRNRADLSGSANKDAMRAALAWYRARGAIRTPLGPIRVPTPYIWAMRRHRRADGRRRHG